MIFSGVSGADTGVEELRGGQFLTQITGQKHLIAKQCAFLGAPLATPQTSEPAISAPTLNNYLWLSVRLIIVSDFYIRVLPQPTKSAIFSDQRSRGKVSSSCFVIPVERGETVGCRCRFLTFTESKPRRPEE